MQVSAIRICFAWTNKKFSVLKPSEVLYAGAKKELEWLRLYAKARLPFDRVYREFTGYRKADPQEHARNLRTYLKVAPFVIPRDTWLHKAVLRHPDLQPNNIFISESFEITGCIDWQHATALPLFLHAGIPHYFQNYGDPDSESLNPPKAPIDVAAWQKRTER